MQHSEDQQSKCLSKSVENLKEIVVEPQVVESELQKLNDGGFERLWEYEEILEILGFGKTQWILLLICGLLTMTSISAIYSIAIIGISSQCEFNITQKEKGVMMAACVTGIALSTYIWGFVSDVWGRRSVLIWSMFFTNFLQLILMFVTNIWLFNFINLIMGISLGGILGPIYPYIGEFNITKYRAIVINYSNMFISVTAIYVPAISWLVLSSSWSLQLTETFIFKPWRLIILFCMLPGLLGGLVLLSFPESPNLLLAHGKHKEAVKALYWIAKFNSGQKLDSILNSSSIQLKSEEFFDTQLFTKMRGFSLFYNIWKTTMPLFQKPHGKQLTMAVVAFFGILFCSGGMQMWFPEIVNRLVAGSSQGGNNSRLCEILQDSYQKVSLSVKNDSRYIIETCDDTISTETYINSMVMAVILLIGFIAQGSLLRVLGRKIVLISCLFLGVLCSILLIFITNVTGMIILLGMGILIPVLAASNMCSVIVDLVPTHLRGKAVSLAFTLGRVSTVLATNIFAVMLAAHCTEVFFIISAVILVCGGIAYYLPA